MIVLFWSLLGGSPFWHSVSLIPSCCHWVWFLFLFLFVFYVQMFCKCLCLFHFHPFLLFCFCSFSFSSLSFSLPFVNVLPPVPSSLFCFQNCWWRPLSNLLCMLFCPPPFFDSNHFTHQNKNGRQKWGVWADRAIGPRLGGGTQPPLRGSHLDNDPLEWSVSWSVSCHWLRVCLVVVCVLSFMFGILLVSVHALKVSSVLGLLF